MYDESKKININGYIACYYPDHPKATTNGYVYEHILVAEQKIGRLLTQEECVHHIDLNRSNNDPNNLMVFATRSDHAAFHKGIQAILNEDGVYICPDKAIRIKHDCKNICPKCGINLKTINANMCLECWNTEQTKHIPSKDELIKLKRTLSNVKIAKIYHVSDKTIGNWLAKYNIPSKILK